MARSVPLSAHSEYRPDVDGLRAVAVLTVLAFHAFPASLPGGFVGVDIFFVISGFLISRIILQGLKDGTFTFRDFYARRVRRIFPALTLVLAACLLFGWWTLLPLDFRHLGLHAASGAAFLSNLVLWDESDDYFDTEAELKPLLHLWSLGVEEQYYLVWPLLLFLMRGRSSRALWMIGAVAAASFATNLFLVADRQISAFYLPQARFWELMVGSAIACLHIHRPAALPDRSRNLGSFVGAAMLGIALVLLHEQRAFPGWWALLPTLGAALLISAGPQAWVNRRILASPGLVFVGLISYPLYLWHWPLLVYARIVAGGEPPVAVRLAALGLSAVLAWLTYELVEKKIRHARSNVARRRAVAALAASIAAVGVCGVLASASLAQARSASLPLVDEVSAARQDWHFRGNRVIPGDTERSVVLIGDSLMQHYIPRVERVMAERRAPRRTVVIRTRGGCVPIPGLERKGRRCSEFVSDALAAAHEPETDIVIFSASWLGFMERIDYYRVDDESRTPIDPAAAENEWVWHELEKSFQRLVDDGKRVIVILSTPRGPKMNPGEMLVREGMELRVRVTPPIPRREVVSMTRSVDERLRRISERAGATWIDPLEWLCTASACPVVDGKGRLLYKDRSHLRSSVARDVVTGLDQYIHAAPERPMQASVAPRPVN